MGKGFFREGKKKSWVLQMFVQKCSADFLWRGCLSPRQHPPDKRWVRSPQGMMPERQLECHKNTPALTATHVFQARRNKQTIFSSLSLLIPPASSPPATGITGRSGKSCQHLAWGCSIAFGGAMVHRWLVPAQQAGIFLEIICIPANSHKCNGIPANFQFIVPTVPSPASSDTLSAFLLKIRSLKCNSSIFWHLRIQQENQKTLLWFP